MLYVIFLEDIHPHFHNIYCFVFSRFFTAEKLQYQYKNFARSIENQILQWVRKKLTVINYTCSITVANPLPFPISVAPPK
jgi:hypothetical protein